MFCSSRDLWSVGQVFELIPTVLQNFIPTIGGSIGYGSPLTLTDTSNKIKTGTKGDASLLRPTLLAAVPAILDRVRDGVRKKVCEIFKDTYTIFISTII